MYVKIRAETDIGTNRQPIAALTSSHKRQCRTKTLEISLHHLLLSAQLLSLPFPLDDTSRLSAINQPRLVTVEKIDLVNVEEKRAGKEGQDGPKKRVKSLELRSGSEQSGRETKIKGQRYEERMTMGPKNYAVKEITERMQR